MLDGVLNGDDVMVPLTINFIEYRSQSGDFPEPVAQ